MERTSSTLTQEQLPRCLACVPGSLTMPAEWDSHRATWFSWPHNPDTWPDGLAAVEASLVQAVQALAEGEAVHINVLDSQHMAHVNSLFAGRVAHGKIVLEHIPTDDAWCRDHGAILVRDDAGELLALDFRFNAWGGKYPPFDRDDAVAAAMAAALRLRCVSIDMVLEGGAIDVNGAGTLLTTEQCLLNPNRNPALTRSEIEAALGRYLGARQVVWLGEGIVGDDTDGHVDDLTRFVAEDLVVTAVERDAADVNYRPLRENLERLRAVRLHDGRPLQVVELPMPEPVFRGRERLPASYANFYIGNSVVLVPVFGCPQDRPALEILTRCFPRRRIVPIDSRPLVVGLGAIHCLTQQVPT